MSLENILKVEINLLDVFNSLAIIYLFATSFHRRKKLQKFNLDKKLFREIFSLLKPDYIETITGAIQESKYSLNMLNDLLNYCKIKNYGHKYFHNKNIQKLKRTFDKEVDSLTGAISNSAKSISPLATILLYQNVISRAKNMRNTYFEFYNQARIFYEE